MTIKIEVCCDALNCTQSCEVEDTNDSAVEEEGWHVDPEDGWTHYCPQCWPKVKAERAADYVTGPITAIGNKRCVMATRDEINKVVFNHVGRQCWIGIHTQKDLKPEHHFINDLGADSLDSVEIVMKLEDQFNVDISAEDEEGMQTMADVYKYFNV